MTNKALSDSRRKLLLSIAAGSGAVVAGRSLPETWTKPLVNSVLLPAHASTTEATETLPEETPPDECCDIDGTYCGLFEEGSSVEITVDIDGAISVLLYGDITASASVNCTGGSFNTADDTPPGIVGAPGVTGTVSCGRGPISGSIAFGGGLHGYTATIDGCSG